jgi:outer membrane protein assembly factor BamB
MSGPLLEHKFMVLCYDRKSGKLLWEKVARTATPHEGHHPKYGSFASNSPVTDGKHVYASFGSRGVYAYTMDGKLAWEKDFGVQMRMTMSFGEGSWPALEGDKLLILVDHNGESFLAALDKNTGRELWRANRPEGTNWTGPVVITHAGKKQILVSATKKACGYDLETGKLLWEAKGLGANTIPAPVYADGVAVVMSGYRDPNLLAIRLGKEGDLTGTDAILWQNQRGNSYTPSPVLHDGKFYFLTDSGMLSCFDFKTGKPYYAQQRLPKPYNFKASPVGANGKLYLASEEGDVIVVKMGEKFEVLATNTLDGQMFVSTPAIAGGEIFLRSQTTLYCVR